jgi:hypothetical protein
MLMLEARKRYEMRQEQILDLVFSGDDGSPWFPHDAYGV